MYALNLAAGGRVLSATFSRYAAKGAVLVGELPEGDITDYLYINGGYVYDPLPSPESQSNPTLESRVDDLETDSTEMKEALQMILAGVTE